MKENRVERIGIVAAIVFAAFLSACATMEEHEASLAIGKTESSVETTLSGDQGSPVGKYTGRWIRGDQQTQGPAELLVHSIDADGNVKVTYRVRAPIGFIACSQWQSVEGRMQGKEMVLLPDPNSLCGFPVNLTQEGVSLIGTFPSPSGKGINRLILSK